MIPLVTIGDSLTQGFQSGSIHRSDLSFPALLSYAMGVAPDDFRVPDFFGEGGLPVQLERLIRNLAAQYGAFINPFEFVAAVATVRSDLDRAEDYWERGPGNRASGTGPLHHNLAVWGFEVADADLLSDAVCRDNIAPPDDDLLRQIPGQAMYRTARRVLNPGREPGLAGFTQVDAAHALAQREGGIENLVFWLGANNALGTVVDLAIRESEPADLTRLPHERQANLWRPEHFREAYRRVADRVDAVGARFVFVGNVPHVSIAPVTRGVSIGPVERVDGYYEFYTRFWVWDEDFRRDPNAYQHLLRDDVRRIDAAIDEYNAIIAAEAAERGWHRVDLCDVLDRLAFRRRGGRPVYALPDGLRAAIARTPSLAYLAGGSADADLQLDTRYVRLASSDPPRLAQGGLFSLDGVHPTTIGYAVIAHEVLLAMNRAWGAAGRPGVSVTPGWWEFAVQMDSLVGRPPVNLNRLRELLRFLAGRGPLRDLMQVLGGDVLR